MPGKGFYQGTMAGPVLGEGPEGRAFVDGGVVASQGEARIAQSSSIANQAAERVFVGAPKFWRITNRAQHGYVKVWMGAFNGEAYPEGASGDKRTWLQPGEQMIVPLEAGLHFVGNIFDPKLPDAEHVIDRMGGFQLEGQKESVGRNAPVRIVGPPIGLPDFIVQPLDGRGRPVGAAVPVYERYWGKFKARMMRRSGNDPVQAEVEKEQLLDRIREYTLDDMPVEPGDLIVAGRVSTEPEPEDDETTPRRRRS